MGDLMTRYKLTDGELAEIAETDHVQCGDASSMARELQTCREATKKPVAWMWKTANGYMTASMRPPKYRPAKDNAIPLYMLPAELQEME